MKIKTSELKDAALNWAVGKAKGIDIRNNAYVYFLPFKAETDYLLEFVCFADDKEHAREQCEDAYPNCTIDSVVHIGKHDYSTNWALTGPIIEQEGIELFRNNEKDYWFTSKSRGPYGTGPTPLIAACRCYVSCNLGEEVDVPEDFA